MKRLAPLLLLLATALSLYAQQPNAEPALSRPASSRHDIFDSEDRLRVRIIYTYGDDGVVETRTLQSFDTQGHKVREEVYTPDENLLFTEDNRYDRQGRVVKTVQTDYDEEGVPHKSTFQYKYTRGVRQVTLNGQPLPGEGEARPDDVPADTPQPSR